MSLSNHICEATTFGHLKACGRCSLVWAADAAEKPLCKDRADPAITLESMGEIAARLAAEIETRQAVLVRTGDRATPYMPALNDAAVLRAIDRLAATILGDKQLQDRLKVLAKGGAS